jgi:uncharacterized protein
VARTLGVTAMIPLLIRAQERTRLRLPKCDGSGAGLNLRHVYYPFALAILGLLRILGPLDLPFLLMTFRRSLSGKGSSRPGKQASMPATQKTATIRAILAMIALPVLALQAPDAAYRASFEKWKSDLVNDLRENWLPLVGLFWLTPGANTFGSSNDNSIVLRSGPAHAGLFNLHDDRVSVQIAAGVHAKIQGKPVFREELQSDRSGEATVIELGSLRLHILERGTRIGVRVKDVDSAAVRSYSGPIFFPLDMTYRVSAHFIPSVGRRTIDVPNVLGDVTPTLVPGEVRFSLAGQDLSLTPSGGDAKKGLSFIFRDLTSGPETYPGGRFLSTDPVRNGKVVLDFNRAYSPPCAVTAYATCPLAPKENRLPIRIAAGEKYHGSHTR